ncbi:calcium-binding protein [Leisingera sp. ANG59]|uniref:calcium-binding protein n=1 Tax=Leisingera sp. ANG59 TaxID=2675221 RepID=UPI0015717874|nr:calcium-binding protein [Leisingera sp. ANG59]NSY36944.1 calcium-binding protein [Leisingera sp. ANG59]
MTNLTINDPSGTWSLDFLTSGYFDNPTLVSQSSTHIVIGGSSGATMTLTGNFSSSSYYYWTVNSLSVSQYGTTRLSISWFDYYYYELDYISDSSLLSGNDNIDVNITIGQNFSSYGGNDTLKFGTGNDTLDGGSGIDTLIISDNFGNATATSSYSTLLIDSADGLDRISGIEILEFTNRTLAVTVGSSSSNSLQGNTISGVTHDLMLGGGGNDTLRGLSGNDVLIGEDGSDRLEGGAGLDQLNGGNGLDSLFGGDDSDILSGHSGDDLLDGGRGQDKLIGGTGSDNMKGGNGNDRLIGGGGNDTMSGGTGSDTMNGGNGRDVLIGHKGDDLLTGGGRADTFVFHKGHGNDTITDFTAGQDHIQIGRGASRLGQLDFEQQGDDVLVSFANVTILVEDITVAQLQDADNFLF